MEIRGNSQSALRLKNIFFQDIHMENSGKKTKNVDDAQAGFRLEKPIIDEKSLKVGLQCKVEIEGVLYLKLLLIGEFEGENEDFLKRMVPNAIAIIFPYMRSQVTLMTAQPNLPPIVLPPININSLLKTDQIKF